jgi:C-3',4' desaturase CrtD
MLVHDLVVIGGGVGGLALAALARRQGLDVVLCEAHTRLGGCAGWFERGPYVFDAGATALMGLAPGEPLGDLLRDVGLDFEGAETPAYAVHLPDRDVHLVPDRAACERNLAAAFPGREAARRRFWRLQEWAGGTLFRAAAKGPRLPVAEPGDLLHDLRVLGLSGLAAASTSLLTVDQVLELLGLADDRPFRCFVAMLLQDTAQAGPEIVPFANAAACLHAYRAGMSRPRGGMRALAEGLGERLAAMGGTLRTATLIDRVEAVQSGEAPIFEVVTRRRERIRTRHVAFNLPIDLAARLLGRSLEGRLARREGRSRARWGALTGYMAFHRAAIDDDSPLFHQVLRDYDAPIHDGNNVLISLSPPGDPGYGPEDARVATLSTHVVPGEWWDLDRETYQARKAVHAERLRAAVQRALPGALEALRHAEYATPRSFHRYTRRTQGAVGGPPVSRGNSNFLAAPHDALGRNLWLVGDSVFPGQGTMAVVLSARIVLERMMARGVRPRGMGSPSPGRHRGEALAGRV